MTSEHLLRVVSVRSRGLSGFGGCIFSGRPIDDSGNVVDSAKNIVVKASWKVVEGTLVQPGQWWRVTGATTTRNLLVDGYQLTETQLEADQALQLRPSGEHIITFLAENPRFAGVGHVKARRLWDAFGTELYSVLESGDVSRLTEVLSLESAQQVVGAWSEEGDGQTLQWLQSQGFDVALGRKLLRFFGTETTSKLEEDPYRLLSFCATWRTVDELARTHFHVPADDPRRLQGAIEEACYRTFAAGHTTAMSSQLMIHLQAILGKSTNSFMWRDLVHRAMTQGLTNGSYVVGLHGVQPLGAYVMERQVAKAVASRVAEVEPYPLLPPWRVDELLEEYEAAENLILNSEQRAAVHAGMAHRLALVTGGAGVGKTTVLKALYRAYDRAEITIVQLALAGRAAKRMQEATGRPATTIAHFLANSKDALDDRTVVVVDETSMVDIVTMSRLCEAVGSQPRLVLAGDPEQLMPVGPGLVLHSLVQVKELPSVHLRTVKRYGGAIASAAADIRAGCWPELPEDASAPISFIPAGQGGAPLDIATVVLEMYKRAPDSSQVLCAVKNGLDGTKHLNLVCQEVLSSRRPAVRVWSERHGSYAHSGFHLGDPVLCTRNIWDRGLQNGSLGVIVRVEEEPLALLDEDGEVTGHALAWVAWDDGVERPLVEALLDDMQLGYAITVHKSQGSQWKRVIVPLTGHRMLDRTLVYTAVTRAQEQVILVGDPASAAAAVRAEPRAVSRRVSLDLLVRHELEQHGIREMAYVPS